MERKGGGGGRESSARPGGIPPEHKIKTWGPNITSSKKHVTTIFGLFVTGYVWFLQISIEFFFLPCRPGFGPEEREGERKGHISL